VSTRLEGAFACMKAERRTGLVAFVSGGDPTLERSADVIRAVDEGGADVIEIGVPFSDPLADGPEIQRSSERALKAGATLRGVLDLVGDIRKDVAAPLVLFSYANPVVRFGVEAFAARAAEVGVDTPGRGDWLRVRLRLTQRPEHPPGGWRRTPDAGCAMFSGYWH